MISKSCDPASFRNLLKVKWEEVWISGNEIHSAKGTFSFCKHLKQHSLFLSLLINLDLAAFLLSYIFSPVKDEDFSCNYEGTVTSNICALDRSVILVLNIIREAG